MCYCVQPEGDFHVDQWMRRMMSVPEGDCFQPLLQLECLLEGEYHVFWWAGVCVWTASGLHFDCFLTPGFWCQSQPGYLCQLQSPFSVNRHTRKLLLSSIVEVIHIFFFLITKYSFILGMWFLMTFSCVHRHMKKALLYLSGPTCLTSGIHISPSLLTDMWVFFFIFIFLSFFLYSFIYIWSACLTKFMNRNASHFSP